MTSIIGLQIEKVPKTWQRTSVIFRQEETLLDQWEAQILARVMCKAQCIFVTGKENRALIEAMHMRWAENADAALEMALKRSGREASVTIIPDGVGVIL